MVVATVTRQPGDYFGYAWEASRPITRYGRSPFAIPPMISASS